MKRRIAIPAAALLAGMACPAAEPEAREFTATGGTIVKYRWCAPAKTEPGKTYPLILFLHGAGERGDDNKAQFVHGVRPILAEAAKLGQPVFLIAPQCPKELWWSPVDLDKMVLSAAGQPNPLMEAVLELVDETTKTQPVDPKRFYVTGISMGGFGTWDLLCRIPDKIAAAIPICGGGDVSQVAKFKHIPIWAFHGEADSVVPVRTTREMISALEKAGGKPKISIYPGVDHDSWTQTYDDPAVSRWLLDQHRD